jgi:Chaperone for flagella basal body P-ring formation
MSAAVHILLGLAGALGPVSLVPSAQIELQSARIRLADVADLSALPAALRARFALRIVAVLPPGRRSVRLSRDSVAGLVRRSVPGLELRSGGGGEPMTFVAPPMPAKDELGEACKALTRPLAHDEAVVASDVETVPCDRVPPEGMLRFDRRGGVLRAAAPLEAGAFLGRVALPAAAAVDAGDRLTLVATVGPVKVEREVVAMQPGRSGGRLFVRDEQGQVSSAPLAIAEGEPR